MSGSVHQRTRLSYGSNTRVTNTYPRKRGRLENLPLNGSVKFEKGFERTDLKTRIARLKSSSKFKAEQEKLKGQFRNKKQSIIKKGKTLTIRSKNIRVNVSTS